MISGTVGRVETSGCPVGTDLIKNRCSPGLGSDVDVALEVPAATPGSARTLGLSPSYASGTMGRTGRQAMLSWRGCPQEPSSLSSVLPGWFCASRLVLPSIFLFLRTGTIERYPLVERPKELCGLS